MEKDPEKQISKKIKELEKMREQEIKERKARFDTDMTDLTGKAPKKKGRFRRGSNNKDDVHDIKEWCLVNAENLKEFVKYGSNKVLDQIRIRNQASVIAREEIDKIKKKEGIDMKQTAITIAVMSIIAVMVYVTVINFMDYSTVTKELTSEKIKVGTVSGQLAACESELAAYKPGYTKAPSNDPPPDTVLEG